MTREVPPHEGSKPSKLSEPARLARRPLGARLQAIRAALDDDPEIEVKNEAVFAQSQLPPRRGVPLLIGLARTQKSREVREQAMLWLGQSGDPRALVLFEEVLRR